MKKLLFLLLGLLVATAALDAAAPPVPPLPAPPVDDTQDVLYLGPGRPAVLRLHLRSGTKPVVARWEAFMAKFFAYLDRNNSGGLDRAEARMAPAIPQMMQLLSGNVYNFFPNQGTARIPFETLDADRDGKVTITELKDYYRKNGAGPVQVQMNNSFSYGGFTRFGAMPAWGGGGNAQDSLTETLFKLLDVNKDGKLSKQELLAAETVLMRLDTNDDELLSVAELGGTPNGGNLLQLQRARAQLMGTAPSPAQNTLVLLPPTEEGRRKTALLSVVRTLIGSKDKDKDNKLSLEESGFPKAFFNKIDRNHDGKLDVLELSRWLAGKPDGEYMVRLAGADGVMMMPARRPGVPGKRTPTGDEMSLTMDNVRLTVVPMNFNPRFANPKQFFIGQFRAVDTLRKGFLMRRQVTPQTSYYLTAIFDLADRNGDGRLTEKELTDYLAVVREAHGAQVILTLASTGAGLFQTLDSNGDGQLSVRELRNAWARLERFDRDKDGCIGRTEFPQQFNLSVGPSANGGFVAPGMGYVGPRTSSGRGPLWFRKMDRNGDSDVSRTEWLGSKADFDRIDADHDDLISVEEAEAFDARERGKGR